MKFSAKWAFAMLLLTSTRVFCQDAESDQVLLEKNEIALWTAWKNHDVKAYMEYLTPTSVAIESYGSVSRGKDLILHSVQSDYCKIRNFSLRDFHYEWVTKDVVVQTYHAETSSTCGAHVLPQKVIASTVWTKLNGRWQTPFHQESPDGK